METYMIRTVLVWDFAWRSSNLCVSALAELIGELWNIIPVALE